MQANRSLFLGLLLALVSMPLITGCGNPEPEDPWKDWSAAEKFRDYVPPTAKTVAKGTGTLTFTATEPGTLYVLDTTGMVNVQGVPKPRALGSGLVPAGSEIIFDPQEKRIYRKGREGVRFTDVVASHAHELRFEPVAQKK